MKLLTGLFIVLSFADLSCEEGSDPTDIIECEPTSLKLNPQLLQLP